MYSVYNKRKSAPIVESSSSLILAGYSSFSAPLYLRTFFHSVFESMGWGRPEMKMVRMARGSRGPEGCETLGTFAGLLSFFTALSASLTARSL